MSIMRRAITRYSMRRKKINPTRVIVLCFLAIIVLGGVLLMLPVSSRTGEATPPLKALFTSTSATCVTGLIVFDTYTHWSFFGQLVILALIQIGGLGFMSIVSIFFFLFHRRIGLRERLLIMQSLSLNEIEGVVALIKRVLLGTVIFEGAGAVILSACFIRDFGWAGGIWRGIFHSISAFCNAGFDLMGKMEPYSSLTAYSGNPAVLLTIGFLIVIGGIGFFVWGELFRGKPFKRLSLHTKLVLVTTAALIVSGWLLFSLCEWNNPQTIGGMSVFEKLLNGLFQSVTTRTAGFNAISQSGLTDNSKIITTILMFIGGSPGSTAGGVKTVTVGILLLSTLSTFRGKREVVIYGRTISDRQIRNAVALVSACFALTVAGAIAISLANGVGFIDSLYELVSAYGTVGLSTGITGTLGPVSQVILMLFMFFGRVGVMTISIAFMYKGREPLSVKYPTDVVIIG